MEKTTPAPISDNSSRTGSSLTNKNSVPNYRAHWDKVYDKSEINQLGWYEEAPEPSLQLIRKCGVNKNEVVLIVGAGATTLVDELYYSGFQKIIANDLSPVALEKLQLRLGEHKKNVKWVVDDLTQPSALYNIGEIDLWHDRAVLHFFTKKNEQDNYFRLLHNLVKPRGFVILATFNLNGADRCSGLPVHRYDEHMLAEKLGNDFKLVEAFDHTYIMPSGEGREYVYTLFERKTSRQSF